MGTGNNKIVFQRKDLHEIIKCVIEVQNTFRKESLTYVEGVERAREKIEETNILAVRAFTRANIVGSDAKTDGIFRYDRRNAAEEETRGGGGGGGGGGGKGFPDEVVRLHVCKERGRNDDDLWEYFRKKGKRRFCRPTVKETKHWVSCLFGSDEKEENTLLKYTEQHPKVLTEVVRMIHRKFPRVKLVFEGQVERAASAVVIQSSFRAFLKRTRLVPSLLTLVCFRRAAMCIQYWWKSEIGWKRR